ncbi:MAG: class I SAM-dependent methyltransferase [Rhabdochlamydiaceae bacterium]
MVQFDKIPLTRRYVIKAIKFAFHHPKIAFLCTVLGIGTHMTLNEYNIAKKFIPQNPVEERMISYSDTWQHMPTLYLLCLLKKPTIILELGCRTGNTALPMIYAAQQYGGHVYSVDVETWPEIKNFLVDKKTLADSWTFIESDDLKLEWDKPINFLYIDTSHTYEQTLKELQKYEPFLQPGGIITLHDICDNDLSKAISDYFKNRKDIQYVRYFNNCGLGVILKN